MSILITATEPSADALGAEFIRAARSIAPQIEFFGCGGAAMREEGFDAIADPSQLAVIGPIAALAVAPRAAEMANALAQSAYERSAAASVLIDSWSFSSLVAARLRAISPITKRYKYAAPQVFASRPGRARTAAKLYDGMMTLFEFETPFFTAAGCQTVCVGNSTLQKIANAEKDPAAFRARHNLGDAPIVLLLPGSRASEIDYHAAPFVECARLIKREIPEIEIVIVAAQSVEAIIRANVEQSGAPALVVSETDKLDAFAAATVALAASGTVSSELAVCDTPMVIAYRTHPITEAIVRRVVTVNWLSLVNIAAGSEVVPELLQYDCTGPKLAEAVTKLLGDAAARRRQREAFPGALKKLGLGEGDAGVNAARTVLDWMAGKN